jgi:heat shock protein HslJ
MQACIRSWDYQLLVDWAHEKKLTRYDRLSDFQYGNILTRQEAATLATRAAEYLYDREVAMCKVAYRDSDLFDTTLTPGISRACGMGIMNGHDGYFAPLRGLTRGEALAVLVRAKDRKKLDETLTPWYQSYMDRAFELGLGFANPKGFDEPITRGEFVEWIKTLAESTPSNDENLLGEWKLESYRVDDMMFAGSGVTISFTPDRYSAKICNTINSNYTTKNSVISAGPAMSTMIACSDSHINTHITTIESGFTLDHATYSIQSTRGDPRTWLKIHIK